MPSFEIAAAFHSHSTGELPPPLPLQELSFARPPKIYAAEPIALLRVSWGRAYSFEALLWRCALYTSNLYYFCVTGQDYSGVWRRNDRD